MFLGRGLGGRGVELFLDFLIKSIIFFDSEGAINQSVIQGEKGEKLQVWGSIVKKLACEKSKVTMIGKEVLGT